MVRTRFAPSPTGEDAHIGTVYTALLNLTYARQKGGKFVWRSEDTDRERLNPNFEENFKKSMNWLGLTWDEGPDVGGPFGPYRQSERLEIYKKYALELVEKGQAYFCFCSRLRLEKLRQEQTENKQPTGYDGLCRRLNPPESKERFAGGENCVVRLKVPSEGQTKFVDVVRGEVVFENDQIDDQVLLKSDRFPTYHLAVVVDDHLMQISHVIRAEEWLSSTPKHVLLYQAFGWTLPVFAHTPLLRNSDKSKLSKRKNPVWVSWYKDQGFLPEALLNFLALQAWSHPEGKDVFDVDEFIEKFSLERLAKTGPVFDLKKLEWFNGEWIRRDQKSKIKDQICDFYEGKYPTKEIEKVLPLVKERMHKLSDFEKLTLFLFEKPIMPSDYQFRFLEEIGSLLKELERPWNKDSWEKSLRRLAERLAVQPGEVFMDLRVALSGSTVGLDLWQAVQYLGETEVLRRLEM